jgi:homoserine dehydrogenase
MNRERAGFTFAEGVMRKIGVGLVGWGTVGCGVVEVLRENAGVIESRLGVPLELRRVADRDIERQRPVAVPRELLTTNVDDILRDPDIQIVVELIGGLKAAKTVICSALESGKHVVTANKALLAHDGNELFALALSKGLSIGF